MKTKSGIKLGLGETEEEVYETMDDLRSAGVDLLTIGQYMQPCKNHLVVIEFIKPKILANYKEIGLNKGFRFVESGLLISSSYPAERHLF